MNTFVVLVASALLQPAFLFDPHGFGFKSSGKDPHGFGFKSSGKGLDGKTGELVEGQKKLIDFLKNVRDKGLDNLSILHKLTDVQNSNQKQIASIGGLADSTKQNLNAIEGQQSTILKGQEAIIRLVVDEHKKTRESLGRLETKVEIDLDKVEDKQKDILGNLQQSENALDQGFARLEQAENAARELLDKALQTVVENAQANAQGQGNITEEIQQTTAELVKSTEEIQQRQGRIQDRISSLTSSEVSKLEKVIGTQATILSLIRKSKEAVQNDISTSVKIEKKTQELVNENQAITVNALEGVQNSQSQTQHLAKKCQDASPCDLSQVLKGLSAISAAEVALESQVRGGLKAVRGKQSQTQKLVESSEKNILEAIEISFDKVDEVIPVLENLLKESKRKVENQLKNVKKDVRDTAESQASSFHTIRKIKDIVATLGKYFHPHFFTPFKSLH